MKHLTTSPACLSLRLSAGLVFAAALAFGDAPVLRWNPTVSNVWDSSSSNWLDATNGAVAWQSGAVAQFDGAGGLVNIAADVAATNLVFTGSGYTLLGAGRLTVAGGVSVASGLTNSVAADLRNLAILTKTGGGALALLRCSGALSVAEGTVLISGRDCADADITVASGAALQVLGGPATNANLVANASFESPALAAGAFAYVGTTAISNWSAVAYPAYVARQNTAAASAWNSAGAAPDFNHTLILQYGGTVGQTVSVTAEGLYSLSFYHFLRSGYPETPVKAYLGGMRVACFMNSAVQFAHQRYLSAPLYLKAGSYELRLEGDSGQSDRASMIDLVCLAPPSASMPGQALGGLSTLRAVTGSTVRMDFSGTAPLARVYVNGALQPAGAFTSAHASGIFAGGGAFSSAAPATIYAWTAASGNWSDASKWESQAAPAGGQDLSLLFPPGASAAYTNDVAGTFALNRLWASGPDAGYTSAISGNGLALTNSSAGAMPCVTLSGAGAATLSTPLAVRTNLTLESAGALTLSGTVSYPPANSFIISKTGSGSATLSSVSGSPACYAVYDGALTLAGAHTGFRYISTGGPFAGIPAGVVLSSLPGRSASFYLTQSGTPLTYQVFFTGLGDTVLGTRCGGGTVTCDSFFSGFGAAAVYDVGAGDTLRIQQLIEAVNDASIRHLCGTVKTGPGTLEIRSLGSNNTTRRAYTGPTTLRNGTLFLSADDCGTLAGTNSFNGQIYDGRGGSLGCTAFTNAVSIGDAGTAPSNSLALIASGTGRYVGHDIEVFNRGSDVTLGMTTGTVLYAGTIILHRDITFSGSAGGVMIVSNVVAAGDFSGTGLPTLSGLAGLRFEGAFPSSASLAMGARALRFGTLTVKAQTLSALSLGTPSAAASLDVDFGAGANDTIAVTAADGLTLSNTVVNLYYAGTGLPFAEPGTYTLFTYAGTLGGDVSLLSVGNPQSGAAYVFANDVAHGRVTLTVSGASGGIGAVWKYPGSGLWSLGSNWDSGSVPDGTGAVPLFGLAITNPATVTLGGARTVGGLVFNNAANGYTLAGDSLTLATNGATPVISVIAGTHTLDTALNGSDGLSVSASPGTLLVFGSNAVVNTGLSLASGTAELRGAASVNGATALAASTTLRAAVTNAAVGSLSGAASSTLELSGTSPKLSVSQANDGTFAGALLAPAGAVLEKTGAAALTLTAAYSPFAGTLSVAQGPLAVRGVTLPGMLSVAAAGSVSVQPSFTNGLMGFYYSVTPNTNNFFTLAAMEAHFATLKPDLVSPSGLAGTNFDFGASGALFPQPYGTGGSRATYFEAVYRGSISIPAASYYTFRVLADDGFLLAIDGKQLAARPYYAAGTGDGVAFLEAGPHDMVLGLFQQTGSSGLQVQIKELNGAVLPLQNAWLSPYSSVGALSGNGTVTLAGSNVQFTAAQNTSSTFGGALAGPAGSLFTKAGAGSLTLNAASASDGFASDISVQGGILTLDTDERLGNMSAVALASGALLKLNASETVGALSGAGNVALGGSVYATAFTGDADCDISASKTYTHTLDFPSGTSNAMVNGVTFYSSGTSGSRNGYGWSVTAGSAPSGTMNASPYDYSYSGIAGLLWDFVYGSTDFTLSLSNLTPGKSYETRLYFRNYGSNPRDVIFTFKAGASTIGSMIYNPDSQTRSWVGCRYTADAAGSVSVRCVSTNASHTCHLYGLSNEEVPTVATAALTLNTPAEKTYRHTGAFSGSGLLTKLGAGSQILGGSNSVPAVFDVQAGSLTFEPAAYALSGAVVRAGATVAAPYGNVWLGGLGGAGTFSLAGITPYPTNRVYFVTYTNDAMTEISTSKTYTHLLDFGLRTSPATVINGVSFNKISVQSGTNGVINGYGWTNFPPTMHAGNAPANVPSNSGVYNLLYDMFYGFQNPGSATMKLTGLTPGKRYEVRFYNRIWTAGDRTQTFTFDSDGAGPISEPVTFNPDASGTLPSILAYRYTAGSTELAITIASKTLNQTYHLYGLSNEEVSDAVYVPVVVDISRDSVLSGPVTGSGSWIKSGAASLTVAGSSTATGALAVNAGAFGAANGGIATLGAVSVAGGATLFGDGRVGGAVAVSSNAWLMAGTATACGTLQIGGALTLGPGARLAYRFGPGGSNDTVTVGGVLTFPTNGTVQASALAAGLSAPAKDVFFASAQAIVGPATLSGWSVVGVPNASLAYSDDRTVIYFRCPRGSLFMVR